MRAVLVLVIALWPAQADAQRAEADAAFQRGRALMKEGDYANACAAFEASLQFEQTTGTLYNLGLCHEKLGLLATAYTELRQVAATDTNKGRGADAARRAAALEPRLTKMKLVVEPVPGLVVERDGLDVTPLAGQEVPVDPKQYTFTATAPGRKTFTAQVALDREGETIEVRLPALEVAAEEVPPPPVAAPAGYPMPLARRPWTMPDGMYELGSTSSVATSDAQFEQVPIDAGVHARIGIQMFELGLRATAHVRHAEVDSARPSRWRSVTGTAAYRIAPRFVGMLEYTRLHPTGDVGSGSDLRLAVLRKQLVAPRIALVGIAGFVYADRDVGGGSVNELTAEAVFGAQATATPRLSFEAVGELGLNVGGELFSHTTSLGFATLALYAVRPELDVFARIFIGLLPAVEGSSSNDFRSFSIGVNWRP